MFFSKKQFFYKEIIEKIFFCKKKKTQEGYDFLKTFLKRLDILIFVQNTWRLPQMRSGQNCLLHQQFLWQFLQIKKKKDFLRSSKSSDFFQKFLLFSQIEQ